MYGNEAYGNDAGNPYDDDEGGYNNGNLDKKRGDGSDASGLLGNDSMAQDAESGNKGWTGAMFDVNSGRTTKNLLLKERLAEIERREKQAAKIERELNQREKQVNKRWSKYRGEKNWPLPFWHLAHHALKEDIPEQHVWKVRRMYFLWCLTSVALFWNWMCFLIWFFWPHKTEDGVEMASSAGVVLLATLYLVAGLPGGWLWIYKRYYNTFAGKFNKGKLGTRHFINFGLHILFVGFMMIGVEAVGSGGLFVMIKLIAHNTGLGVLFLINFVLFTLDLLASMWLFRQQRLQYGLQIVQDYVDKNGGSVGGSGNGAAVNFLANQAAKNPAAV